MPPHPAVEPLNSRSLSAILAGLADDPLWNTANIVIKPAISADGKDTFVYNRFGRMIPIDDAKRADVVIDDDARAAAVFAQLAARVERGGVLLQPYMHGVEAGEYALIFFGRTCSHAVQKPPLFKGDGSVRRRAVDLRSLPPALGAFAQSLIDQLHDHYGLGAISRVRVDLFDQEGTPVLCELELVDPNTNSRVLAQQGNSAVIERIFAAYADVISTRTAALLAMP